MTKLLEGDIITVVSQEVMFLKNDNESIEVINFIG